MTCEGVILMALMTHFIRATSEYARQRDMTKRIAPLLNPPPAKCAVKEGENSPIAKASHLFNTS